jgi:hypothetical protein
LEEGLSDKKPIGEAGESEVGMIEPRILPNQIQEVIKSTWYLVSNHHYTVLFDENRTWKTSFVWEQVITSYHPLNGSVCNITRRIIRNTVY